jgi:hypothetical protein
MDLNLKKPEAPPSHFDACDDLPEEDVQKAYEKADEKFKNEHNPELDLEKSTVKVRDQEWVLVSFIGPNCRQKTEELGMKVWGAFGDIEKAREHLVRIGKLQENKMYDIFMLEMYAWAVIPPDPLCIEDQEFHDNKLNELISSHKKEKYRAQEVFDTRKNKLADNPDVNQYKKNKALLSQLNEDAEEHLEDDEVIQNKEAMEKVFGKPEKLPDFTVEPEDNDEQIIRKGPPSAMYESMNDDVKKLSH